MATADEALDQTCPYCMIGRDDSIVSGFGIPLCDLGASRLVLFREQSHRGRVVVASTHHVDDVCDLTEEQAHAFADDVRRVAAALHAAFSPDKINFGAYGDTGHHLHVHIVPKYADDGFEWGGTFAMNPDRVYLTDEEYDELGKRIMAHL